MKLKNNTKYIAYIILFIIFLLIRINYVLHSSDLDSTSFKSLAISSCSYPFGIIKETALHDTFLPFYYLIIGILKNEILIKIFNSIIAFLNVILFIKIGKKIKNRQLGIFLGFFLSINHFFLYYTNIISPYCLIFLFQTLLINSLIDYFKKPSKTNFKKVSLFNCFLILCDTFGFLYVICELIILYFIGKRKKIYIKLNTKLLFSSLIAFLIVLPILIIQYIGITKLVIPITYNSIGLNFSSLFLMLSEYITPYLSFSALDGQNQSTLGMLYSYFLNPDITNINSLKILITLFYSSIFPLILIIFVTFKAYLKNVKLRLLWLISIINFSIIIFLILIEKIDMQPIYSIQFFITNLILLGYGIFSIKDNIGKIIIITCICLIQLINPELNSFNITLNKNCSSFNVFKNFVKEYNITQQDLIYMPNEGKLTSMLYKKLKFYDYDNNKLKKSTKKGLIKNLSNKKVKKITQKNINYVMKDYLIENKINSFLIEDFIQNFSEDNLEGKSILVIDKLNEKPISKNSIRKIANENFYSPKARKIDFKYPDLNQNQSKNLYDALISKTLYNMVELLCTNFELIDIVEYKKIDNEYYKIKNSKNVYKAISSFDSDYVFLIFKSL